MLKYFFNTQRDMFLGNTKFLNWIRYFGLNKNFFYKPPPRCINDYIILYYILITIINYFLLLEMSFSQFKLYRVLSYMYNYSIVQSKLV